MAKFGEEYEGGGEEESLGAKGAALFNKRMAATPEESEDGTVTVQEPEEDDELDETPEAPSRKDRRAQRGADRVSARERAAAAEARAAVLQEQLDAARRAPAGALAPQRQPGGNPYQEIDAQIRKTFQDEKALNARWVATSAKASAAEIQAMEDEAAELVVRRQGLIVDRKEVERAPRRAEEARIHDQRTRFPDVFGDPRAFQYAQGAYNQALARGEPATRELEDASFQEARQVILGKRPPPDQATRQRASGVSSGVRSVATVDRPKISMPKGSDYDRIARAAFPKLDPAEARQKWANTIGKKLLSKQG